MEVTQRALRGLLTISAAAGLLSACSFFDTRQQLNEVDSVAHIYGNVDVAVPASGQAYAVLLRDDGTVLTVAGKYALRKSGNYSFYEYPGSYLVGAFVDLNGDGEFQRNEPATYNGMNEGEAKFLDLKPKSDHEVANLTISGLVPHEAKRQIVFDSNLTAENLGKEISLDDPRFSDDYASLGMWRPLDFLDQIGGGLYLLEPYRDDRIPVIFVHGINGSPRNWAAPIEALDRTRYQAWIYHYPSGLQLDIVSDYLLDSTLQLQQRFGFEHFYVAAHSMGGLVTRSFVKKYTATSRPASLDFVMTVNSPLYGMKSANSGVKHSPLVVPAWRDVGWGSDFIEDLHAWQWPESLPYYLAFSYGSGKGDDGVVALESQLSASLQKEAVKITGYDDMHTAVLSNPLFIEDFKASLAEQAQP